MAAIVASKVKQERRLRDLKKARKTPDKNEIFEFKQKITSDHERQVSK